MFTVSKELGLFVKYAYSGYKAKALSLRELAIVVFGGKQRL